MKEPQIQTDTISTQRGLVDETLRWFASLKLAVVLIVGIAVVLAEATVLESAHGREYVQWHIYKSPWFMALLGLMSLNIVAATMVRFPWRRGQRGFLLTHAGVVVLLAGAMLTFTNGIDGQLALEEGQSGDAILLTDHSQITTVWRRNENPLPSAFIFQSGPSDWADGKTLDLGSLGDVQLEVLKFYRRARVEEEWVKDPAAAGSAAIQLALSSDDGKTMAQQWLVADPFADEVFFGPARLTFQRAAVASILEDFTNPPSDGESDGVLSIHHEGRMQRIPVRDNLGKKVAVDNTDIQVEITSYLPDARPGAAASFTTASQQPNNPLLELKVYLPGKEKPLRQIAFAKNPLLSLDGIHGWECPVKFWYHHPAVPLDSGVQFLQTPDGKVHYRVIADGKLTSHGEVQQGARIALADQIHLSINQYLPHAERKVTFLSSPASGDDAAGESAVQVRVQAGGQTSDIWLKRGESDFQQIVTPQGTLGIAFGYERLPLGFAIKLVGFEHAMNPGMMGDASFASSVRVIDKNRLAEVPAEIAMNQPLVYGGFTFYQSGHDEGAEGKQVSILTVAADPGRFLKYLGCFMVCFGVFGNYYGGVFSLIPAFFTRRRSANATGSKVQTGLVAWALLLGSAAATFAADTGAANFDWQPWRALPVQDGGREKPLDTLARETFRTMSSQSGFVDPQTQQKLDPTAFYLTLFFSRQQSPREENPQGMSGGDACPVQSTSQKPDAWDREPLLFVDSRELRTALGLPADQAYVSCLELSRAQIEPPAGGPKAPFAAWSQQRLRVRPQDLSPVEKKGMELAERYRAYQDVRRGRKLALLPVKEGNTQPWLSVTQLLQANLDDKNDPSGQIRTAKKELLKAQAAFLAGAASDFNAASANFMAALRAVGPQLGDYPSKRIIDLEVAYNHAAPFRLAWICSLLAFCGILLGRAAQRPMFHRLGLTFYAASIVAMLVGFGAIVAISGRAPVTNMYESVLFVGLGTAIFGLVFELVSHKYYALTAAAAVATLTLLLADNCPAILDPSIRPLTPVLRSNFWLVIHVMTIMLSYAAFALALLIGNATLGFYLRRQPNWAAIAALSKLTYCFLQAGVLLLILGTFLGASWADYAWGRFWGWDPKEVWALITLLGYLAILHARSTGWLRDFGLAAFSVVCFTLIVMAWYGVNFVLSTGLHSYGFGGGGRIYVVAVIGLQFIYVGIATLRAGEPPK